MIPDKHQIQVTISTSYKGAKEWFDFLKQKGCDVGLYKKYWFFVKSCRNILTKIAFLRLYI